jgi:GAF domain-containing protein
MQIDPAALTSSIDGLYGLDLERGLAPTLQQVVLAAKTLFRVDGAGRSLLLSAGIHAAVSVPVEVKGGPIGTLDIYSRTPREWDDSEVGALQAYAGIVSNLLGSAAAAQVRAGSPTSSRTLLRTGPLSSRPRASSWNASTSMPRPPSSDCER